MAQRKPADDDEDDTLELTPDMETDDAPEDEPEDEEGEPEGDEAKEGEEPPAEEGEEEGPPLVGFEDEADQPAEGDNTVIRALRERNKTLAREVQELRINRPAAPPPELPEKPTLADYDYDEEKFEVALTGWHKTKQRIDDAQTEQERLTQEANREWQRDMETYASKRDALNLPDFEDSAETVKNALSLPQQATIIKAAGDAAAFVYALGRSDARLAELAKIHDPIKLAAAVARMEGGIKVVKKRKAPAPDRPASGAGKMPGSVDKQLEKLEADADRTGNRTELLAYRKKLKARGKQ